MSGQRWQGGEWVDGHIFTVAVGETDVVVLHPPGELTCHMSSGSSIDVSAHDAILVIADTPETADPAAAVAGTPRGSAAAAGVPASGVAGSLHGEQTPGNPKLTGECWTCGYPGLRAGGHASWCAAVEAMSDEARTEAVVRMAAEQGGLSVSHSLSLMARIRAAMAANKARPVAPDRATDAG